VSDAERLYVQHDVLVFPSRWEGLGNAVIEAMASGRPVVATDLDVLHEVLGDLGRFAPAGNAPRFADELAELKVLPADETATLSHALRERAIERFDPAETTRRLIKVYENVRRSVA
jgi:glycosyltransferase involved in cell wall biosynthesis